MKRVSIEKDFGFLTRDVTSEKTFQSESEHKKVRNEYSCISPCMSVTVVKCSKYEFISRECSCCMCACMRERGGERESLTVVSPFYFFQFSSNRNVFQHFPKQKRSEERNRQLKIYNKDIFGKRKWIKKLRRNFGKERLL